MNMGTINNECPTEVLIDIREDEKYLSCTSRKETKSCVNIVNSKTKISSSNIEGNTCSKSINRCETILDISFSRIGEKFRDKNTLVSEIGPEQSLNSDISDGCPTAVLIDVSPPTVFCSKDSHVSSSTQYFKDGLNGCKSSNIGHQDSKGKLDKSLNYINDCKARDSHSSSNSSEAENQIHVKRLRWKTPSPQSMSRISKEASKIIDHLHSSSIFDEDLLLTEEILPVTLNFDELDDDDDTNLKNSGDDSASDDLIDNRESLGGEQSLNKIEKNDEKLTCDSSLKGTSNKILGNLKETLVETNIIEASFRVSSKDDSNSKESYSSGIHSNSVDNSGSLTYCDEVDDVFTMTHIASEDKENVQNKRNKGIYSKENKIGNKTASRNFLVNRPKLDQRSTLRNLSNIKQEASARRFSLSVNKNVTTPMKRMSISGNKKVTTPHIEKPQIKKTTLSVNNNSSFKGFSPSKSFQFQNTKALTSSALKSRPTIKFDAGCSSLSSDVKQQNVFATPLRRYSICTPLKSASAMKPPLTPAMTSSHNFVFPRYTPQPSRPSRLSFSRSWQPPGDNSHFFPAKGLKQQISTTVPSSTSKCASGIKNSTKPGKLPFSQSMSSVPLRSTGKNTNKGRFSSKVPSPLSLEKDKKVARALFTSVAEK